jgi:hypothetical protein
MPLVSLFVIVYFDILGGLLYPHAHVSWDKAASLPYLTN